jgi:quinol-cytochrome oxidoreductase complex cytochrome b subunit
VAEPSIDSHYRTAAAGSWAFVVGAWVFVIYFIVTTVKGALAHYSPVPFSDMWSGYLGFYVG